MTVDPKPTVLVVEPVFAPRIWGGSELRNWFGLQVPDGPVGECWAVSGMAGASGMIQSGPAAGLSLREAWSAGWVTGSPEPGDFPLLCKILDARDWLSVQVHPNDSQASSLEHQPRGKAECWTVLACDKGAELILGHTAPSTQALREAAAAGTLMTYLNTRTVAEGDFFMVPAGEVHAVGPGLLIYEVQQSSDITYRLYDFDRVGTDGRPRDLHQDKGLAVVTTPSRATSLATAGPWQAVGSRGRTQLLADCPEFSIRRWQPEGGQIDIASTSFRVLTVVEGSGALRSDDSNWVLERGSSLVIPASSNPMMLEGELTAITSEIGSA